VVLLLTSSPVTSVFAQQWMPPIQKLPHVFLQTEVLGQRGGVTRSLGKGTIEASPGRPGSLSLPLELGPASADHPTSIEIEVTQNEIGEKIGLTIATTVEVTSRTGEVSRVRRERIAEVDEGRSFFHQAYENAVEGTSLLLTMTPETRIVPQLVKPKMSAPVFFSVTLSRVMPNGEIPLEENVLRTLEGSPVSYAFRISTGGRTPVEATAPVEGAELPGETAVQAAPPDDPASTAPAVPVEQKSAVGDAKSGKSKPKKMSRKEREKQALADFQRAREDASAQTSGATGEGAGRAASGSAPGASPGMASAAPGANAASLPASGAPPDSAAAASPPGSGASPSGAPSGGDGGAPGREDSSTTSEAGSSAGELELTLIPRRVESGILMVEASLRGRAPGQTTATLIQRTHALSPNSSFDIALKGPGPSAEGFYKFTVQARF